MSDHTASIIDVSTLVSGNGPELEECVLLGEASRMVSKLIV